MGRDELMEQLRSATAARVRADIAWWYALRAAKDARADTVERIALAAGFQGRDGVYAALSRLPRRGANHDSPPEPTT